MLDKLEWATLEDWTNLYQIKNGELQVATSERRLKPTTVGALAYIQQGLNT